MKNLILTAALLLSAMVARATGGLTPYSIGSSSGTSLIVISVIPVSYWGIDVSSAAANDLFKCWNSTSTSGLTIASAATLSGVMYQTPTAKGSYTQPYAASNGVVCGKSSTSSEAVVLINP